MDRVEAAQRPLQLAREIELLVIELDEVDGRQDGSSVGDGFGPLAPDRADDLDACDV